MKPRISDLWRWEGPIGRGPYLFWGLLLFALKYGLDRFVVESLTQSTWRPWDYFFGGQALRPLTAAADDPKVFFVLLAMALPFIWVGLLLTFRRLRGLGWPGWFMAFFFIPFLNLVFFTLLAAIPSRDIELRQRPRGARILDKIIPRDALGSAFLAVVVTALLMAALAAGCAAFLMSYGWGLFVGIPFMLGLVASLIYGYHGDRSFGGMVGVTCMALALVAAVLVLVAIEGLICVLMASPIALLLALAGAVVGSQLSRGGRPRPFGSLAVLPLLLVGESSVEPPPDLIEVATVMEIDAPPERVWPFVIAFHELPPPEEALFRAGIAYPIRAEIFGEGPGAIRHCTFSTGAFVEPIEVWDPPRRLKFGVTAQPPAMKELSPWPGIQPAHVNDFLVTRAGQFLLEPMPGGGTRVTGTTWYEHRMWPALYWRIWSDSIIHAIHARVLDHIKRRAEPP
jgi:uncharacterized membrane protein YhaH (DUF805 family)